MAVARAVRYGTHSRWTTEYASLSEAVQLVGDHGDLTAVIWDGPAETLQSTFSTVTE